MISVITATYNDAPFIEETIESVANQSFDDWEWIIVINGSSDKTLEILSGLKDSRIRIITLPYNLGVSAGRNKGLEVMQGDYFCFLDGDDLLPENSLSARLAVFQSNPDIEFVDGKVISFMNTIDHQIDTYVPAFQGDPLQELLSLSGSVFKGNTWMIKKVEEKKYAFLDGLTHGEELLFYASVANSGLYDYTETPILYYRRHENSAMKNVIKLAKGYLMIGEELTKLPFISQYQLSKYKVNAALISLKSLLKDKKPVAAVMYYLKIKWL
jgi:teichuronic acid biosynthesis glycosyltransferase TuaG